MRKENHDAPPQRGFLQSEDGEITRVLKAGRRTIAFEVSFGISEDMARKLRTHPEHIVFSERSRIARLGVQIGCPRPFPTIADDGSICLTLTARSVITDYPDLAILRDFFAPGLRVGRLVFCDPEALLSSGEVIEAIRTGELKLPASTAISSNGSIVISPHKLVCRFPSALDHETLERILFAEDGREILNRYQVREEVRTLSIPPGEGIVTTCSMYLNHHFVVLDSGFELGEHLASTVLDPIKTRGIRVYLEIYNGTRNPIVNPMVSAKVYRAARSPAGKGPGGGTSLHHVPDSYRKLRRLRESPQWRKPSGCHFLTRPAAILRSKSEPGGERREFFRNGPIAACDMSLSACAAARRDFTSKSLCPQITATSRVAEALRNAPGSLVLEYFPNHIEHRDILAMASECRITSLTFFQPSYEHGSFFSQRDHIRLQEYHERGLPVVWVSAHTGSLMVYTERDGKGYFVKPERRADFQKSMIFAFFGSNRELSDTGKKRLVTLMDALVGFWGRNIGIVTGGGSGVMLQANALARERGILSGANFLEITDQDMTQEVDFCQLFQATCRHSRQKWFEVASFPIFNVGGIGSLEELGITLCNMKLGVSEHIPVILFDTEGDGCFWTGIRDQVHRMVEHGRAPRWIESNLVFADEPEAVIEAYSTRLQLL